MRVPCPAGNENIFADILIGVRYQAGNVLLNKISSGSARLKMLIAQVYIAFLENIISTRQPNVTSSGNTTAVPRSIIRRKLPLFCRKMPTSVGRPLK